MTNARRLTIGEVARRAGLRPSALRYYESAGLLPAPARANGWRRYDAAIFDRIAILDLARQAGFTLKETRALLQGFSPRKKPSVRWATLARKKLREIDALIARANEMKRLLREGIECGCPRIEVCPMLKAEREPWPRENRYRLPSAR